MPRPFLPSAHFTERDIPHHLKVKIVHLHDGNSTPKDRHGFSYATIAKLFHKEHGDMVAESVSYCSKKDLPSRKVGRMVAIGRALKEYYTQNNPPF